MSIGYIAYFITNKNKGIESCGFVAEKLNITGKLTKTHLKRSQSYIERRNTEIGITPAAPQNDLRAGTAVYHLVFGIGKITEITRDGYTILFENGKIRTLSNPSSLSVID